MYYLFILIRKDYNDNDNIAIFHGNIAIFENIVEV
jgi:hypothetical protein